ncbi:MAG: hypothetical protein J5528_05080 [Firmicutes bacterium]|nr:hypothetical protein [Bacillota bacterium]
MKKHFKYQNYIVRYILDVVTTLVLFILGIHIFLKCWMILSGADAISIEMFAMLSTDKVKGSLLLFGAAIYMIIILAYKRIIYPEITSKTKLFVRDGYYEAGSGHLHIHTASKDYKFDDIDSITVVRPKEYIQQYGYAKIDFAAAPVRYMMDGKIVIKGNDEKCIIYVFSDNSSKDSLSFSDFTNDIISSFASLRVKSETVKMIEYE